MAVRAAPLELSSCIVTRVGARGSFVFAVVLSACSSSGAPTGASATASSEVRVPPKQPVTHNLVKRDGPAIVARSVSLTLAHDRMASVEGGETCKLRLRTLPDRKLVVEADTSCDSEQPTFSPDGNQLLVLIQDRNQTGQYFWSLRRSDTLDVIKVGITKAGRLAWGPNGLLAATGASLRQIDLETGEEKALGDTGGQLSPDGTRLMATIVLPSGHSRGSGGGHEVQREEYDLIRVESHEKTRLPFPQVNGSAHFWEGGVVLHSTYRLYPFSNGGELASPLEIGFVGDGPAALSWDGKTFAVEDGNYNLMLYDIESGHLFARGESKVNQLWCGPTVYGQGSEGFVVWDVVAR